MGPRRSSRSWRRAGDSGFFPDDFGQSTVEFAVVSVVMVIIAVGLWAIASMAMRGQLVERASESASHVVDTTVEGITDVVMY